MQPLEAILAVVVEPTTFDAIVPEHTWQIFALQL
jgi:hypothetical protein